MGLCASSEKHTEMFTDEEMYGELVDFGMSFSCVQKLYDTFSDACTEDQVKEGLVDKDTLYSFLKIGSNGFTSKLFTLLDTDERGVIDFSEFCVLSYLLCFENFEQLVIIVFDLYGMKGSGYMSVTDVRHLLLVGEHEGCYDTATTKKIITILVKELSNKNHNSAAVLEERFDDLEMNLHDFHEFVGTHRIIMEPIIKCQEIARHRVHGVHFWQQVEERQRVMELHEQALANIEKFLLNHTRGTKAKTEKIAQGSPAVVPEKDKEKSASPQKEHKKEHTTEHSHAKPNSSNSSSATANHKPHYRDAQAQGGANAKKHGVDGGAAGGEHHPHKQHSHHAGGHGHGSHGHHTKK